MNNYIDPGSKILHHLDRVVQLKRGLNPPPVNVEIDVSNRCSRGCNFCHFAYTHTKGPLANSEKPSQYLNTGDLMTSDLAMSLPEKLAMFGVKSITWTGGGEPTLHPDFDTIIDQSWIDQGLYTHGGHINPFRAQLLKERMTWVYVSLDCPTAKEYSEVKAVDEKAFYDVLEGINNLVQAKGAATIGVGFLLGPNSNHSDMLDLGNSLGADYIQYRPTIHYNQSKPGELVEETSWINRLRLHELKIRSGAILDVDRFDMYKHWQGHGYETCWWSGMQCAITPNGKVWACVNKRGYTEALLGDLHKQTFREIWQGAPLQKVNDRCRIMCRGHVPNKQLVDLIETEDNAHKNFI